jgi:hypothetical protein
MLIEARPDTRCWTLFTRSKAMNDHAHHVHVPTSRRNSGSTREDSPSRGRTKRHQIAVACNACRRRKTKVRFASLSSHQGTNLADSDLQCNGSRPTCSICVSKNSECTWSADPDATPMIAMKRKYKSLETESRDLNDLMHMLINRPRKEAQFILDHVRRTRDASSTLSFIREGDLLTWGANGTDGGPSQSTPSHSTPSDHDSVRYITDGVKSLSRTDGMRDVSQGSTESVTGTTESPRKRLAISDLVNNNT